MTHYSEDDLALFFYGEGGRRAAVQLHLDRCPDCAALYQDIASTLRLVAALDVPERDDRYGLEVWQRIRPILPAEPPSRFLFGWSLPRLAACGALAAALVIVGFLAGRGAGPTSVSAPPAIGAASSIEASDRMRMAAISDHLEQSERLLLDFVNAGGQVVDVSNAQAVASDLVETNRLYREAASGAGDTAVADVLDALERSLIEIAHGPSQLSLADFNKTRMRVDASALLFKVRVLSDELRERESSADKTPNNVV